MSLKIMSKVWETQLPSHTQKLVLLALADNANDEGACWPSYATLARKCDLTERAVQDQINLLESEGWLAVESGSGRRSSRYQLQLGKFEGGTAFYPGRNGVLPRVEPCSTQGGTLFHRSVIEPSGEPSNKEKIPPPMEELKLEAAKIGLPDSQVQMFYDFYESKGWFVGKTKMVKWRSALAGWKTRWQERIFAARGCPPPPPDLSNRRPDILIESDRALARLAAKGL